MTHDPMCYFNRESGEFDFMADRCPRCELIAKVRADERERVVAEGPYFTSVVHDCCVELQDLKAKS